MLIFPVTCRFGVGARLALEPMISPVRAKSQPEFRGFFASILHVLFAEKWSNHPNTQAVF